MNLTFYPKIDENGAIENDDLDLQIVNLHAIENYGINIGPAEMGREWAEHVYFPSMNTVTELPRCVSALSSFLRQI